MADSVWWEDEAKVQWARLLLDSYRHWLGRDLINRSGTDREQAGRLFTAPFVVVSHGMEQDPILNYGNRLAFDLWEIEWNEWSRTPSRLTAEPIDQAERAAMLTRASGQGVIEDYRGVRVSRSGKRFRIEQAVVWTVLRADGVRVGQAATFARWIPLADI